MKTGKIIINGVEQEVKVKLSDIPKGSYCVVKEFIQDQYTKVGDLLHKDSNGFIINLTCSQGSHVWFNGKIDLVNKFADQCVVCPVDITIEFSEVE